jgi:hypothetical protein
MTRLLELIIILFVIILISTFAGSLKEGFVDSGIDAVSRDLGVLGLNAIGANPNSGFKSFVAFVPTLDDLLKSNYIKKEFSAGLNGAESISARTCSEETNTNNSLMAAMNSNKNDCNVFVDLQQYSFMATTIKLQIFVSGTDNTVLVIKPDDNFKNFLLRRPVVFTIDNSKPYLIDWGRNSNRMLFTTYPIKSVQKYKDDTSLSYKLPIKQTTVSATNFFPAQANDILTTIKNKNQALLKVTGNVSATPNTTVDGNVIIYYLKRKDNFGNKVSLSDSNASVSITNNSYINSILQKYKIPKTPYTKEQLQNPTLTVNFTLRVGNIGDNPWWFSQWPSIISIGSNTNVNCDNGGRGILLVELRPTSYRQSSTYNNPYIETAPSNPAYSCADFTNVERNVSNTNWVGACGDQDRALLWFPTGVNVDISYIVSSSMKVIVASFYDPITKTKQLIYTHNYGVNYNDIIGTIRGIDNIYINNVAKRNNYDINQFKVSNIEVSYGMQDLYEWYNSI